MMIQTISRQLYIKINEQSKLKEKFLSKGISILISHSL